MTTTTSTLRIASPHAACKKCGASASLRPVHLHSAAGKNVPGFKITDDSGAQWTVLAADRPLGWVAYPAGCTDVTSGLCAGCAAVWIENVREFFNTDAPPPPVPLAKAAELVRAGAPEVPEQPPAKPKADRPALPQATPTRTTVQQSITPPASGAVKIAPSVHVPASLPAPMAAIVQPPARTTFAPQPIPLPAPRHTPPPPVAAPPPRASVVTSTPVMAPPSSPAPAVVLPPVKPELQPLVQPTRAEAVPQKIIAAPAPPTGRAA